MRPHYELLLLDFGGVCLLNPVELHEHAEKTLDLPPGTLDWLGPLDPSTDPLWRRMIAGDNVTERDYWRIRSEEVGRLVDQKMDVRQYMELLYNPPRSELIRASCSDVVDRAQQQGVSVSVFTNDLSAFHGPEWAEKIELLQRIDHLVDCSHTGILKPDPRAYERALTVTGFDANQVLFVDDQPLNVKGAQDVGIDAIWFDVAAADVAWKQVAARVGLTD